MTPCSRGGTIVLLGSADGRPQRYRISSELAATQFGGDVRERGQEKSASSAEWSLSPSSRHAW